jgi:toxin secretion/phage lysis holin
MTLVITKLMAVLLAIGAVCSGIINLLLGGWSKPMTVLCILMALDYISGLVVAIVYHKSPKTPSGGASSAIGLKGLLGKLFLIFMVSAAYQIDKVLGTTYLRDAVALAFIANEALSLVENAGLMGIPMPKVLLKGIEILKGKAEEEELPEGKESHKDDHPPDGSAESIREDGERE